MKLTVPILFVALSVLSGCGGGAGSSSSPSPIPTPTPTPPPAPTQTFAGIFRATASRGAVASAAISSHHADSTTTASATMMTARTNHAAIALSDGRVLVVGGYDNNGVPLNTGEVFDPVTETFTPAVNNMCYTYGESTLVKLNDGRILIFGGGGSSDSVDTCDISANHGSNGGLYDPEINAFISTPEFTIPGCNGCSPIQTDVRNGAVAYVLEDGNILVYGGTTLAQWPGLPVVINPYTWTEYVIPNGDQRSDFASVQLPNGTVVISGGSVPSPIAPPSISNDVLEFNYNAADPASSTFTKVATLVHGRKQHSMAVKPDGSVYVYGGVDSSGTTLSSIEHIDPVAGTSTPIVNLPDDRSQIHSADLQNGRSLIVGGVTTDSAAQLAQVVVDEATNQAGYTQGNMTTARLGYTSTVLPTGRVVLIGGGNNTAEVFEPQAVTYLHLKHESVPLGGSLAFDVITDGTRDANGNYPLTTQAVTITTSYGTLDSPSQVSGNHLTVPNDPSAPDYAVLQATAADGTVANVAVHINKHPISVVVVNVSNPAQLTPVTDDCSNWMQLIIDSSVTDMYGKQFTVTSVNGTVYNYNYDNSTFNYTGPGYQSGIPDTLTVTLGSDPTPLVLNLPPCKAVG